MKKIKILQFTFTAIFVLAIQFSFAQYKEFKMSVKGDTINRVMKDGTKEGKWVIEVAELRGEPGYVEEGAYVKGYKHGPWRKYSATGDLLSVENYLNGGKDGEQQYFTYLGDLVRIESWKGYNPDAPYDTIAVYGTGSGEIIDFKISKAEPYSVKHGEWKYFNPGTGELLKTEMWELNNIKKPESKKQDDLADKKKEIEKTPQMLEWEKKNRGKKGAIRDGRTGVN